MDEQREIARVEADTPCHRCTYNLRGLAADSVCPECAASIAESVRVEANRPAPLPGWLRVARSGFFAAMATLWLAPVVLPKAARWLGMPVVRRYSVFDELYGGLVDVTFVCGLIIGGLIAWHRCLKAALSVFLLVIVWGILLPALGNG